MFLLDSVTCWSASDLTLATQCEFALLRGLDLQTTARRGGRGPA